MVCLQQWKRRVFGDYCWRLVLPTTEMKYNSDSPMIYGNTRSRFLVKTRRHGEGLLVSNEVLGTHAAVIVELARGW